MMWYKLFKLRLPINDAPVINNGNVDLVFTIDEEEDSITGKMRLGVHLLFPLLMSIVQALLGFPLRSRKMVL